MLLLKMSFIRTKEQINKHLSLHLSNQRFLRSKINQLNLNK